MIVAIRFVDRRGRPSDPQGEPADAIPVMDVVLAPPAALRHTVKPVECIALVDTGADYCSATESLLDSIAAPLVRTVGIRTAWEPRTVDVRDATVIIPRVMELATDVQVGSTHPYSVILGRCLLQNGKLVMDYAENRFEWHYAGART